MIPFLLVVVVIVVVGVSVLAYRGRPESSIESGIRSFRREMRALAPPPEHHRGGPHLLRLTQERVARRQLVRVEASQHRLPRGRKVCRRSIPGLTSRR